MDSNIRARQAPFTLSRISFQHAQEAFLLRCRAQNLSPLTIEWYKGILKPLGRFLAAYGIDKPENATPTLLRSHLDHLKANGHCSGTLFRTYGALRCFFHFLSRERMIPANPMSLVEKPRKEKKLIQALTSDQARILLAQPDLKTFGGLRGWTIMILILDTGLRLAEVVALRRDQIDFQNNILRVLGKGRKERTTPIGHATRRALEAYAQVRGSGGVLFFLARSGRPLRRRYLQGALKRYGRRAGIEGVRVSPHSLRHTFAIQYVKNGGDAFSLQAILGHASLDMVRNYVNLARRDVAEQHGKFSPMAWLAAETKSEPPNGKNEKQVLGLN